jgi:CDP-glycerol glycerophosphotransferase
MSPPVAPPALSLVLAVHGEQGYVPECVASVLEQDVPGIELVAVDDGSADHAGEVLDELAEADARLRVHHLEERIGPGPARNAGLGLARGEHVWFVDATDLVAPHALGRVAEALRAERPDVLLLDHDTQGPLGPPRHGRRHALIERLAGAGAFRLASRPDAAELAPDAWSMVVRRALLRDARFGAGRFAALTVTWPALAAAPRIVALRGPAYVRRRPANAQPEPGSAFDAFAQWEAVLAALGGEEERRLAAAAMQRHLLALLPKVPAARRGEFARRMAESAARHHAPAPAGRAAAARSRLAGRGDVRSLRLLDEALAARRRAVRAPAAVARRGRRSAGRARRSALVRGYYPARRRAALDPDLAVFAAYWFAAYSCNPRAIYEKARELVPSMRGVWVVKPSAVDALPPGVEHVLPGTREYFDLIARATYFVNNVNYPNHLVKREGSVHVMTHHGTPLKRMGLDLARSPVTAARMDFPALLRRAQRWDFSVSQNPFSSVIWERVFPTPFESIESGYPRNDVLATATDDDVRAIRARLNIEPGQTAVLYAPTHREYASGYVHVLDLAKVAEALGPDHVLLARLHYFYGEDPVLRELHRQGRVRDVAAHPSIEELSLAADALVTDYSSLMFDYAVLDRPIVIHAPDWETYRSVRGTYFDLMREPPGVVTRTDGELADALRSRAAWGEDATRLRAAFRERFCALDDGRAAERVVRRVWLGERRPAAVAAVPAAR